jgi:hypothetical protein
MTKENDTNNVEVLYLISHSYTLLIELGYIHFIIYI